jgi:probable HAF family extracellular repeat protein
LHRSPFAAPKTTDPWKINNNNQIVGIYTGSDGGSHGFLFTGGAFTTIDAPYAASYDTRALGINDAGEIVGQYADSSGVNHGFLFDHGSFIPIDFPGAVWTQLYDINDQGRIVGEYPDSSGITHGFLFSGGIYSLLDFPGAGCTQPYAISNSGQVAAICWQRGCGNNSALYIDGAFMALAGIPGAAATQVFGMNTNGDLVGTYTGNFSGLRGFTATPVPEPSTFSLVAAFVGALAFCVAKRHGLECKPRSVKGWSRKVASAGTRVVSNTFDMGDWRP